MRIFSILFLITALSCSSVSLKTEGITGIKIYQLYPDLSDSGKLKQYLPDTTLLFISGKLKLYRFSYMFDSSDLKTRKVFLSETRYHDFIFHSDSAYGIDIDNHKVVRVQRHRVDSLLNWQWAPNVDLDKLAIGNKFTRFFSHANVDSGTRNELYDFTSNDGLSSGTLFLGYNNTLNKIGYSFSKYYDALHNMKLYKVRVVQNARFVKGTNLRIDKFEYEYNMQRVESIPKDVVVSIQKYRSGKLF